MGQWFEVYWAARRLLAALEEHLPPDLWGDWCLLTADDVKDILRPAQELREAIKKEVPDGYDHP